MSQCNDKTFLLQHYAKGFNGYLYKNHCSHDIKDIFLFQVLPGSHLAGRIDHVKMGGQLTADPERMKHFEEHIERVHANLNPGDALFFHCEYNYDNEFIKDLSNRLKMVIYIHFLKAYNLLISPSNYVSLPFSC